MQNPKELIEKYLNNWCERNSVSTLFEVSIIADSKFGDLTTNLAMGAVKEIKGVNNPKVLADQIVLFLKEGHELNQIFEKIEVAGAGFINFYLSQDFLSKTLKEIVQLDGEFGKSKTKNGQSVIVEYSSPNIAKPFTVGHLRSTIIGDAIANLLEAVGFKVIRDNHLGDWGTQFGKQIYAIKAWGNEEEIEKSENPVKELVALYIKFHEEAEKDEALEDAAREWFLKLEKGDNEARRLWQKCIDWSFKEFDRLYSLLGVSFTENGGRGYGESYFEDKMDPVISELRDKNLLKKSEGAELVFFPDEKFPPLMILKKDGSTLYATRDLATDKFRLDTYGADIKIINEVGMEQELYFRQLFEIEKMLGWVKDGQRVHIKHGHYRFAEGKMSTRKGNVIWLDDVLEEAQKRASLLENQTSIFEESEVTTVSNKFSIGAKDHNPSVATRINNSLAIGIGAIKWNDLKRDSKQDITFDWDDILNMHGNSGPYLQYSYVRTLSVIAKAGKEFGEWNQELGKLEPEETDLLRFLSQFPYQIEVAALSFSPNLLCNYLFELSQKFNLFYQKCKIIGTENEAFRLELTKAVGVVLKHGLQILGIETVEKM